MDLPHEKGTYVLIASVRQVKRIEIGQLGEFEIVPGFYAYVFAEVEL
jgi:Uri superfamily endonuclease